MKKAIILLFTALVLASCTKEVTSRADPMMSPMVSVSKSTAKQSTQVKFHLVSVSIAGGTGGWWTMNNQEGWDGTGQMLQQWFQHEPSRWSPNEDSTFLYLSHNIYITVPGQEELATYEDGQLNIHLIKQSESTKMVDGMRVTTQRGKWELTGAFGIYSMYTGSVGGQYTYTFTPQEPQYYYVDGVAYPYGETKREVYLHGVLQ